MLDAVIFLLFCVYCLLCLFECLFFLLVCFVLFCLLVQLYSWWQTLILLLVKMGIKMNTCNYFREFCKERRKRGKHCCFFFNYYWFVSFSGGCIINEKCGWAVLLHCSVWIGSLSASPLFSLVWPALLWRESALIVSRQAAHVWP